MSISKIVITGGRQQRGAALQKVNKVFSQMGYTVFSVPALEINRQMDEGLQNMPEGVAEGESSMRITSELAVELISTQMKNEKIAEAEAKMVQGNKKLIVCLGGLMDIKTCMAEEEFQKAAQELGLNIVELRDGYDAVFCITDKQNQELLYPWVGNTHMRVTGCEEELIEEIKFFLGEPEPLEIERKFLIEYPDLSQLEGSRLCRKISISQTYLKDNEGNFRVRRRGEGDANIYFMTRKKQISETVRVEIESNITKDEYEKLIAEAPKPRIHVEKDRYCLIYEGQYFEVDVFPFWKDRALMEIELTDEDQEIKLPPMFKVIREVTTEDEYKNSHIAKMAAEMETGCK